MEATQLRRSNTLRTLLLIFLAILAFGTLGTVGYLFLREGVFLTAPAPTATLFVVLPSETPSGPTSTPFVWPATWTPPAPPTAAPTIEKTAPTEQPTLAFVGTMIPIEQYGSKTFTGSGSTMTPMLSLPAGKATVTWHYSGSPLFRPSSEEKAIHDNQIEYIKNVHQANLDMYQKKLERAKENHDEYLISYWQNAINDEIELRDTKLDIENKRYDTLVKTLAAGDHTLFEVNASQPEPLGIKQIVKQIGPGSGKISLDVPGGEGYFFTVTAYGPWTITVKLTK